MRRIDAVHLGLMCAAVAVAYVVPFELLLFSYVVLGPAHYLTEISWLHDRKYFLPHPGIAIALAATAVATALITDDLWFGLVVWAALAACAFFAASTGARTLVAVVAAALTLAMLAQQSSLVMLGTLVPTLIHVSLFTLVFMIVGAHKSGLKAHWLLIVVYIAAIALIIVAPPSAASAIPEFAEVARDYFGDVAPALGQLFGLPDLTLDGRMTGLLAFLYTYHYLNWFIKADVIRWADVPKPRLVLVAAGSAGSTALYFHDYALGFTFLLALSNLHVFLEFPLNSISLRQLGTIAAQAATARSPARVGPAGSG
jgi:hypothetical protein